jgi:hypothetical protein
MQIQQDIKTRFQAEADVHLDRLYQHKSLSWQGRSQSRLRLTMANISLLLHLLWIVFLDYLVILVGVADPGFGAFLTPGMGKKSGFGSGMNNPEHIS